MPWNLVKPVVNMKMQDLCLTPYPNHSKGCPNWGKKPGCPPHCKPIGQLIDLEKDVWAVWTRFDLGTHVEKLRGKYPDWTDRQLKCCLYWQPKARVALRQEIALFQKEHPGFEVVTTPEASGVCLTPTMKQVGIELEWPPEHWTYQIILAGCSVS